MIDMNPNIARAAALIGDASRAAILMHLLDGRMLLASELARLAGITPQTASAHLSKLVEGGLLVMESHGRHHYFRLASSEVAQALEALAIISPPAKISSLRQSDEARSLRFARTCYDHLAGTVGVALTDQLLQLGWIEPLDQNYQITAAGMDELQGGRRHFARQCLDWSERRHHIAGKLGTAITNKLFELNWVERIPKSRALRVTKQGLNGLQNEFGLHFH